MIGVELARVVADEPITPTGQHARARCQPTAIVLEEWGARRITYLPQLALVVVDYAPHPAVIIPVEHVWHMTVLEGESVLGTLAQVIA